MLPLPPMREWLHVFHCRGAISPAERLIINLIRHYGEALMAKLSDATTRLNQLSDQVGKIKTEVEALKAASENMDTTPEFDTALERLGTALQGVDEINADQPVP